MEFWRGTATAVELIWRINREMGAEPRSSTDRRWVALLIFL